MLSHFFKDYSCRAKKNLDHKSVTLNYPVSLYVKQKEFHLKEFFQTPSNELNKSEKF